MYGIRKLFTSLFLKKFINLDPDTHGSAFILTPGSGSAFRKTAGSGPDSQKMNADPQPYRAKWKKLD